MKTHLQAIGILLGIFLPFVALIYIFVTYPLVTALVVCGVALLALLGFLYTEIHSALKISEEDKRHAQR